MMRILTFIIFGWEEKLSGKGRKKECLEETYVDESLGQDTRLENRNCFQSCVIGCYVHTILGVQA
jgi:hypothetical protein